jgi:hypothetical protein
MIDESELAEIVQLFAGVGSDAATSFLAEKAMEAIEDGRTDTATRLLDLSEAFSRLRLEMLGSPERDDEAESLRTISFSLRSLAHALNRIAGERARDRRLLRLVRPGG